MDETKTFDGSMLDILLELKQATIKTLKVGTLAIVKDNSDTANKLLKVTPFPILEGEKEKLINCFYLGDTPPNVDEIILVIFLDKDFINNLKIIHRTGTNRVDTITNNKFHSEEYGIAIKTY